MKEMIDTQAVEKDAQEAGKTFTQEEVSRIVQERLARVKAASSKEEELNNRENELNAREMRLKAREIFTDKKLPSELLDVLSYSDEEQMNKHIEILEKAFNARPDVKIHGGTPAGEAYYTPSAGTTMHHDSIREAMGLR